MTGLDSATKLVAYAYRAPIDVVVLDVVLDGMTGVDAVRLLRAEGRPYIAILLLTAKNDAQSRVEGLRLGADDYVGKPFDENELVARVEALARTKRHFEGEVAAARRGRSGSSEGDVDPVTGLFRTSVVDEQLNDAWQRAVRQREPFAVSVLSLRPAATDPEARATALFGLGTMVYEALPKGDSAARIGDNEILLLLPGAHVTTALARIQRLHSVIAPSVSEGPIAWGVAVCPSPGIVAKEDLLRAAHAALKQAEQEGPGTICLQEERAWILDPAS